MSLNRLSARLLDGSIRFEVFPGVGYLPFQGCVQKAFPGSGSDLFPLAFGCPLFAKGYGAANLDGNQPEEVWRLLPPAVLRDCNLKPTIFFICDVIDALSAAHGWDERAVGEWLQQVEDAMMAAGLDMRGRPRQ